MLNELISDLYQVYVKFISCLYQPRVSPKDFIKDLKDEALRGFLRQAWIVMAVSERNGSEVGRKLLITVKVVPMYLENFRTCQVTLDG